MRLSVGRVLERLAAEGLSPTGAEERARAALAPELADDLPWYMRTAVAIGAWLATIFVLFSLFAVARIRDERVAMFVGALLAGAGILVRRKATTEFQRWAAVALTLAGLGMLTFGIAELTNSAIAAAAACLVVSAIIIRFSPDATLRFICALAAASALFVGLVGAKAPYSLDVGIALVVLALAWIWRGKLADRSDELTEILAPVGYGLAVALFGAVLTRTLATSTHAQWSVDISRDVGAIGPVATIACTGALVTLAWRVLDEQGASLSAPGAFAALGGAVAIGAVTLDSPGIVAGLATLMLAFDRRNRVLLGMAAIFLLVFGSFYYYSLELTLLEKAGVLGGSGLILLGVRGKVLRG